MRCSLTMRSGSVAGIVKEESLEDQSLHHWTNIEIILAVHLSIRRGAIESASMAIWYFNNFHTAAQYHARVYRTAVGARRMSTFLGFSRLLGTGSDPVW